jgi:hypothetical protein
VWVSAGGSTVQLPSIEKTALMFLSSTHDPPVLNLFPKHVLGKDSLHQPPLAAHQLTAANSGPACNIHNDKLIFI